MKRDAKNKIAQGVEFRNKHTQELSELLRQDLQERSDYFNKKIEDDPSPE